MRPSSTASLVSRERSRVARAASALTGATEEQLLTDLDDLHVAVVLDEDASDCELTAITAVRIALLTYGHVTLVCPPTAHELTLMAETLAGALRPRSDALEVRRGMPATVDGVLHIGSRVGRDYRSVTVGSDRWLIRMAAADAEGNVALTALPRDGQRNEIGEIGAACMGMGELWLRVLGAPRAACNFEWSLFDYAIGLIGTLPTGPGLPDGIEVHGIQIGAGTVGGGFDLVLETLPVSGDLAIVDSDFATSENFGAHPLFAAAQEPIEKVELAREALRSRLEQLALFTRREWYSFFKLRIGNEVPVPDVVISAVDKVRPRHDLQRLWASLHIDLAATGGVQCQVIVRTNPGSGLCLLGFFNVRDERPEADDLAELTGLRAEGFDTPTRALTNEDVSLAPLEKRASLAQALGRGERWCNVALAAALGATTTSPDFVGAASHNAILAGLLGAAELVKARGLGLDRDGTFVQWHSVSRKCFVIRSRCLGDCDCAMQAAASTV